MLETYERHSKRKLLATVLAVVVIAGTVVFADALKSGKISAEIAEHTPSSPHTSTISSQPTTASSAATATTPSSTPSTSSSSTSSGFRDGSYTASSSYYVPHGNESIKVNLTLSGGVIENISIQNSEGDGTSAAFQQDFASSYKSYVVGKQISGLQLSVIAGASDTTQGFADALDQIASQAKA